MIQDINMVGRERLAFLYGLYSGCAKSETELNIKGIYQEMASELAWCLGFNENYSICFRQLKRLNCLQEIIVMDGTLSEIKLRRSDTCQHPRSVVVADRR